MSGLAGDILTLASEDRESVASRGIVDPVGDKMELQGTAAEFRAISGSAVVEESVPNEDAAGLHGHRDDAGMGHVGVTDLPVPAPEVHRGALSVAAGNDVHATVFGPGLVEGDPHAGDTGTHWEVEIGVVLMPWLLPAETRRFQHRLVSVELRRPLKNSLQCSQETPVGGKPIEALVKADEALQFSYPFPKFDGGSAGEFSTFPLFELEVAKFPIPPLDQIGHGLESIVHLFP